MRFPSFVKRKANQTPFLSKRPLFFFHRTLQRVLMPTRFVDHLSHLGLSYFVGVQATYPNTILMYVQHDLRRVFPAFVEVLLKDVHNKLHWRVIIVKQEYPVKGRFLGFGTCFRNETGGEAVVVLSVLVSHRRCVRAHRQEYSAVKG